MSSGDIDIGQVARPETSSGLRLLPAACQGEEDSLRDSSTVGASIDARLGTLFSFGDASETPTLVAMVLFVSRPHLFIGLEIANRLLVLP